MKHALHHIHKRKVKKHKKGKFVEILDKTLIALAIIGPGMTIPQIFKIFYYQNAEGVSLISWTLWAIQDIPWIIYGVVHKEKPIIIAYCLWLITNICVITGVILYG